MRILIGTDIRATGSETAWELGNRLASALAVSHDVHVVRPAANRQDAPAIAAPGVTEHPIRSMPLVGRRNRRISVPIGRRRRVREILDRVRPDVVHVLGQLSLCRTLVEAAHDRGIAVVATSHLTPEALADSVLLGGGGRAVAQEWLWRNAARSLAQADVVTAPTPYAAALVTVAGIRPVHLVSTGVDLARFRPGIAADAFRARHGVPAGPTIGFVGRLDPDKCLDVLIRALPSVRAHVDARLLVVGDGTARPRLQALAGRLGLAGHVVFTGFVPEAELPAAYAAMTVFATAGAAHLRAGTLLEAMACGRAIVGPDAAAVPGLMRQGRAGLLFPPGDAGALAGRLVELLTDPFRTATLGLNARELAGHHDQRLTAAEFDQLYRNARHPAQGADR
ncbi:putative glycosyltransferase [Actinoplanes missouriensis 431]|uniref:Putative glycosyltransferase n=1 Tax=Actinoplanes missouriensis (strain ATCC 14538 / DSM 43046 / CBS 188.64 / JCM 3121 / NBRC 102363 / NCIMB 12654 / NRRL B-3342 / UNCC 431) TaxID=512565 RepID=I0H4G7_ACTM4|nr:glycosyltransferase [Actinoplanes missouriensis]BAL87904.1 putative glycosyltransferase [Actinoplanes missouriensis 431]